MKRPLNLQQRYQRALIIGPLLGLGLGILYGVFNSFVPIEFSIVYVFIGYGIGALIQKFTRGVGSKFALISVGSYILAVLVGDIILPSLLSGFPLVEALLFYIESFSTSVSGLLSIAFRILGGIAAYQFFNN